MKGTWVAAVLVVFFLAGCRGDAADSERRLTRVSGTVYRPAEGVVVDVYRPGEDLRGPPFTQLGPLGAGADFALELPAGKYVLVARRREDGHTTGPVRKGDLKTDPVSVEVAPGEPVSLQMMAFVKEGNAKEPLGSSAAARASIRGRVLDPEGQPLEGVRVHVYDHVQMSERPRLVSARTGPDGRYEVDLPEGGTYYLCARDQYGGPPRVGELYGRYDQGTIDPSGVIVPEGETVADVDITVHTVW